MKIKVCGMREVENIRAVDRLGVDWMGFIFYPRSPRYLPADADHIAAVRSCQTSTVGVFVDAELREVLQTATRFGLQWVQLHGDETATQCAALRAVGLGVIKALRIASRDDLHEATRYVGAVDYLLLDTRCEGYGGSGQRFDWSVLDNYTANIPFLLSGGLAPGCEDVLATLHHPRLCGVDLNSGFESAPGCKRVKEIETFIRNINQQHE